MRKAVVIDLNCNWSDFRNMIEDVYKDDSMKKFMLSDSKPSNWGYIGKQLVKIDYGD
jgi:hypothetical protein